MSAPGKAVDHRRRDLRAETQALLDQAMRVRNDQRRQGEELRPLGRKARETRAALLEAGYNCFVDKGYRRTSVEDIHEAIGVSIGTFYQYFRDKADLMTTLVAEAIIVGARDMVPDLSPLLSEGPQAVVAGFVRGYAATAPFQAVWEEATHHEPAVAEFRADVRALIEDQLAAQIAEGQDTGVIATTTDPSETARALAAMVDGYCYLTFVEAERVDRSSVDAAVSLLSAMWGQALGLVVE